MDFLAAVGRARPSGIINEAIRTRANKALVDANTQQALVQTERMRNQMAFEEQQMAKQKAFLDKKNNVTLTPIFQNLSPETQKKVLKQMQSQGIVDETGVGRNEDLFNYVKWVEGTTEGMQTILKPELDKKFEQVRMLQAKKAELSASGKGGKDLELIDQQLAVLIPQTNQGSVLYSEQIKKNEAAEAEKSKREFEMNKISVQEQGRWGRAAMSAQAKIDAAKATPGTSVNVMMNDKAINEVNKQLSKNLVSQRDDAMGAAKALQGLSEAKSLLNSGMITGSGAEFLTSMGNVLASRLGFKKYEDPVANTQAFAATMGSQVAQIIKQFGAGTGLSDADREYAEKIVGGKISLNEEAIKKLIDINERGYRNVIKNYNKIAKDVSSRPGAQDNLLFDLEVEEPEAKQDPLGIR